MALANDLQIQRQHQGAALGIFGALNHAGHGLAVAHHVQLKPKWRGGVLGNVFDGADAHGREGEGDAKFFRRPRGVNFAIGVLHAGQPHRGDAHRHAGLLAHHGGGGAAPFHVYRHALAEFDGVKIAFVGTVGAFGPRARVGIVVKHARHAALSHLAQVFDAGDFGEIGHGVPFIFHCEIECRNGSGWATAAL